jgi:hypothetical protein
MSESPDLFNYIAYEDLKLRNDKNSKNDENANDTKMTDGDFEHLSDVEMKQNIKNGIYFQGKVIFQPNKLNYAIVRVHLFDKEIILDSTEKINRAYHGDIVCVEILKESGNKNKGFFFNFIFMFIFYPHFYFLTFNI